MNFEKYVNSKLYYISDILFKLIIINSLFFITSSLGLLLFTFMPALVACYILIINIIQKKEFPLFKTFWKIFKQEYFKAQKVFFSLLSIGIIIGSGLYFYYKNISFNSFYLIAFYIMFLLGLVYILTCLQVVFVYIHFPNLKTFSIIKNALILSLGFLFQSIALLVINLIFWLLIYLFEFLVVLVPIILISLLVYLSYMIVRNKYYRIAKDELIDVNKYL